MPTLGSERMRVGLMLMDRRATAHPGPITMSSHPATHYNGQPILRLTQPILRPSETKALRLLSDLVKHGEEKGRWPCVSGCSRYGHGDFEHYGVLGPLAVDLQWVSRGCAGPWARHGARSGGRKAHAPVGSAVGRAVEGEEPPRGCAWGAKHEERVVALRPLPRLRGAVPRKKRAHA